MSQIGTHNITVSYQGLTTTFDIEVIVKSLKSISATGVKKTEYMPGEKLDLTGLVVKAIYNNGTSSELSADDYTVSGYTGTVGNNIISVTYGGKSATFVVVVHNPSGEWVVTKEATCTAEGVKTYICTNCGDTYTETIKMLPHTYKVITPPATTVKNGSKVKKCSSCGAVAAKTVIYRPATVTLSKNRFVYSGKVQKPVVVVK